ncbi:MAG TPA: cytochrome c [Thermoanaerobaculia bacterium]|nr:cytochrome c [Thermoanaerobaculia bacterium]
MKAKRMLLAAILVAAACTRESPSVARGAYLANGVARCFWCHSPLDNNNPAYPKPELLGSGDVLDPDTPIVAGNLTPDVQTGLGNWKDAEIIRAIREGVGRDGHPLRAHPGSYYSVMTDHDAASVVAYLRTLKPIRKPLPKSAPQVGSRDSIQPYVAPARTKDLDDVTARGAYLAQLGECLGCHTTTTLDGNPAQDMRFGGGRLFFVANGVGNEYYSGAPKDTPIFASANLTPHSSGIPYYTENVFVKTIRSGRVNGVRPLSAAMPWIFFRSMTDADLRAVFAYLKTLPPVAHNVSNAEPPTFCRRCKRSHGGGASNR